MGQFTDFTITVPRGDTCIFAFVVKLGGVVQDLDLWEKFWFTAKRSVTDPYSSALIALTDDVDGGITRVAPPSGGTCQVKFGPLYTFDLTAARRDLVLVSDVQGKTVAGDFFTLLRGTLILPTDVTDTPDPTP